MNHLNPLNNYKLSIFEEKKHYSYSIDQKLLERMMLWIRITPL